ncbi:peptidylprolyl isomerase [Kamptonema formosum]|uniref:peptidylprolyl isomerase n=1 Tax=Kamptonema formosum TaxID=331992 RepID=UPI00035D1A86
MNLSASYIEAGELLTLLKRDIQFKEVSQRLLHQKLIEKVARERGVTITPEEIEAEANRQRYEKRLQKASDTLAWLADQMMTADDWEAGIRDRLLAKKLADYLFAKEVEKFFAQNKLDFEEVLLYQILLRDEKLARELYYEIENQEITFYQAARLYDIDERRRLQCGYEGKLCRWGMKPAIAAAVFSAPLGEPIGPLRTEQGYYLLMVEEFIPAQLSPERYQELLNRMFQQWLNSELNYHLSNQSLTSQIAVPV